MELKELLNLFRTQGGKYLSDILPGGLLNEEWTPERVRTAAEVGSMEPGLLGSTLSGLLAVDDARKGDYGSAALNAVGLLPFVPGMAGVVKSTPSKEVLDRLYSEKAIGRSEFYPTDVTVNMTPEDYLKLTYPLDRGAANTVESINEIKDVISSGGKLADVPYLVVDKKGAVKSQEGRHRATAVKELGYEDFPVVISATSDFRNQLRGMTPDQIKEYMRTKFGGIKSQPNSRVKVKWEE